VLGGDEEPVGLGMLDTLVGAQRLRDTVAEVAVEEEPRQAARVSDSTGFFNIAGTGKPGKLIEIGDTSEMFSRPTEKSTEDYITGRFG